MWERGDTTTKWTTFWERKATAEDDFVALAPRRRSGRASAIDGRASSGSHWERAGRGGVCLAAYPCSTPSFVAVPPLSRGTLTPPARRFASCSYPHGQDWMRRAKSPRGSLHVILSCLDIL